MLVTLGLCLTLTQGLWKTLCLPHPAHPLSQAFHLCILGRTLVAPDPVPLQNESCMSPSLYLLLPGYLLLHHHIPLSAMGVAFLN